jgi:hypothetical protein
MSHDARLRRVFGAIRYTQRPHRPISWRSLACPHFCSAVALVAMVLFASPARAVNPSVSGTLTVPFLFVPDDPDTPGNQSYWYWSGGISGSLGLSVPSVMEITNSVLGSGLDWNNPNIWNTFPLDSGGLFIGNSGSGTYNVLVNSGSPNLSVLGLSGPTEGTVQTRVDISNIHGSGSVDGFGGATVLSNTVATKYNVTIPAGAHVIGYPASNVQNLTINHNASLLAPTTGGGGGSFGFVRQNLTNHGTAELNGEVQGNFITDALPANGDVAKAVYLVLDGQLQNTGELQVTQYFKTAAATSNAGTMKINGGDFNAGAVFANNGTILFSNGNIYGPGAITNNGTFQWANQGVIRAGAQVINTTNAFTIVNANTNTRALEGTLTNAATITQSGGSNVDTSGTIENQAGALYDITDDSHVSFDSGHGTINNAGTFRKSGGTGDSLIGTAFNSTGTLAVTSGRLRFKGGGTLNGGAMSFSGGHVAEVFAGDVSVIGTNTAVGDGAFEISAGHMFVDAGNSGTFANFTNGANLLLTGGLTEAKSGGTLTFNLTGSSTVQLAGPANASGGTVGGLGSTINTGNFQWVHGSVVGNFTNSSNNFTIVAGDQSIGQSGQLTNANTSTISQGDGSNLSMYSGGVITNQAGALWVMSGTNGIFNGSQAGPIANAGTWRKSGASTTSTIQSVPFNNTGTLAIESGKLFILGPNVLNLMPTGTLLFKLSGLTSQVDFGTLEGTHTLTAGGKLAITLGTGFAPALGNSFDLIDWCTTCSLDGSFSTLALPPLASGLKWDSSQLYTTGVLAVGVAIPGDFNQNGVVDTPDYVVWRKYLGTTYTQSDFNAWRSHIGQTAGSGAASGVTVGSLSSAVPEPNGVLCGIIGMVAAVFFRRPHPVLLLKTSLGSTRTYDPTIKTSVLSATDFAGA